MHANFEACAKRYILASEIKQAKKQIHVFSLSIA